VAPGTMTMPPPVRVFTAEGSFGSGASAVTTTLARRLKGRFERNKSTADIQIVTFVGTTFYNLLAWLALEQARQQEPRWKIVSGGRGRLVYRAATMPSKELLAIAKERLRFEGGVMCIDGKSLHEVVQFSSLTTDIALARGWSIEVDDYVRQILSGLAQTPPNDHTSRWWVLAEARRVDLALPGAVTAVLFASDVAGARRQKVALSVARRHNAVLPVLLMPERVRQGALLPPVNTGTIGDLRQLTTKVYTQLKIAAGENFPELT